MESFIIYVKFIISKKSIYLIDGFHYIWRVFEVESFIMYVKFLILKKSGEIPKFKMNIFFHIIYYTDLDWRFLV